MTVKTNCIGDYSFQSVIFLADYRTARYDSEGFSVTICVHDGDVINVAAADIDGEAFAVPTDVTDVRAITQFVSETVGAFDGIDVVVNNAGILGDGTVRRTLYGRLTRSVRRERLRWRSRDRTALPHFRDGGGSIVNAASEFDIQLEPAMPHYNVSKAALLTFMKSLSKTYGDDDVHVNADPSARSKRWWSKPYSKRRLAWGISANKAEQRFLAEKRPHIVFGRAAESEEIAGVVAFLANDDTSFITSANYRVDGGSVASMSL